MSSIKIDADGLFRAVSAHDFKLMGYYLDLRSGEVTSRTLAPEEIKDVPVGPTVKPLPALGADIHEKKGDAPFGPVPVEKKADLFKDEGGPKKPAFEGGFWERGEKKKLDPFGDGGHRKESATRKLAEMFGDKSAEKKAGDPFAHKAANTGSPRQGLPEPRLTQYTPPAVSQDNPLLRIPPAGEEQHGVWMRAFAKDCGDPQIREKLEHALGGQKAIGGFERVLRNYQRMNEQWMRYYFRQTLHYARAWLKDLPVQWEIVEREAAR